jgi:SAM-dependent methyltransferase
VFALAHRRLRFVQQRVPGGSPPGRYIHTALNRVHGLICSSRWWARTVDRELLPWGLRGVELGEDVLEIGPGFGATTSVLARSPGSLSVLELEPAYCERLRRKLGERVQVTQGDATSMPFEDGRFSAVVSFTMLHHLPSRELQDRVFGEVARVLRPGGVFAGTDSVGTGPVFRVLHIGDTLVPVDPGGLPERLLAAGLAEPRVQLGGRSFRFSARRPSAAAS